VVHGIHTTNQACMHSKWSTHTLLFKKALHAVERHGTFWEAMRVLMKVDIAERVEVGAKRKEGKSLKVLRRQKKPW
jgi:hypothetical protein